MNKNLEIIAPFLPKNTAEYVLELLERYPVHFKIVHPRKTKLGDFKVLKYNCQITINNNLDPLNFLITTLHEIAHLYNWKEYGRNIAPHGIEWKNQYVELFLPILNEQVFSKKELHILRLHLADPKASSCADVALSDYLKKEGETQVKDLQKGDSFLLNGKQFTIEKKLRTRYLCIEYNSKQKYYVNGRAVVEKV